MKKLTLVLFFIIITIGVQGQGIFHYYTGLVLPDRDAPNYDDRLGIDLYYNSWTDLPLNIKVKPYSIGVNVFRIYDIPFGESNFGAGIGWSFSSHNVHHNGAFIKNTDSLTGNVFTSLEPFDESYDYKKNKISLNYIELPVELRFRTNSKRKENGSYSKVFRFYPGFKIGYLTNIHTTLKDDRGKFKFYNYDHLNRIRYGATLKIGYEFWTLHGFYSLSDIFKEGKGTKLQSYAIGLTFYFY